MKKTIIIILHLLTIPSFSQEISPMEIIFGGDTNKINAENIENIYSLILEMNKHLHKKSQNNPEYNIDYKSLLKNSRQNEIGKILLDMKNNLDIKIISENDKTKAELTTEFKATNKGPLDLSNYPIEVLKSSIDLNNDKTLNTLSVFDYSQNEDINEITGSLNYKIELKESKNKKFKLDLILKAFNESDYKILSKEDIQNGVNFNDSYSKLINITENHIAFDQEKSDDILLYLYKNEKISSIGSFFSYPMFKPIYDYLLSKDKVTKEMLFRDFPIKTLKKINTEGTYHIVIPDVIIGNQIIIYKKKFKKLKTSIKKTL